MRPKDVDGPVFFKEKALIFPKRLFVCAAIGALFAAVLAVHIHLADTAPFLDEGDHANTGRLLARGALMYRDAFNEKGPGLYWITAGLFSVLGDRFLVVRYAATAGMLLSVILMIALAAQWGRMAVGLIAAFIFGAFHILCLGRIWQSESVLTPMFLAALVLQDSGRDAEGFGWRSVFAGMAMSVATLVKQTAWLAVPMAFFQFFTDYRSRRSASAVGRSAGFTAGLALPWIAILMTTAHLGYARDFLEGYLFPIRIFDAAAYASPPSPLEFYLELPVWWMAFITVLYAVIAGKSDRTPINLAAFSVAAALMIFPAVYPHHFLPMLALGSLGFVMAVAEFLTRRRSAAAFVILVGIGLCVLAAPRIPRYYLDRVGVFTAPSVGKAIHAAVSATEPSDPILVFPHDSTFYYLTGRRPPGRYGFFLPWTTTSSVLREAMGEIASRPPKIILYMYQANATAMTPPRDYLAPLLAWIAERYRVQEIFENRVIVLAPLMPGDGKEERCGARRILYADFFGWHSTASDLTRYMNTGCRKPDMAPSDNDSGK